ncbi:hypothetical protein AF70_00024210 [Pseudomonas sp. KD5]|nr:hypothetical protein [Pseudomonas sp. KD5]
MNQYSADYQRGVCGLDGGRLRIDAVVGDRHFLADFCLSRPAVNLGMNNFFGALQGCKEVVFTLSSPPWDRYNAAEVS